jgi:hypothetical protein
LTDGVLAKAARHSLGEGGLNVSLGNYTTAHQAL